VKVKPVVWGILSRSAHYRRRIHQGISKSPLIDPYAIASRSRDSAEAAARELGFRTAHPSYEALLADPAIEAVFIPLPNHLHAEWVRKAADAGKHVLCEKPFAMNAREAEEAIRHAESRAVLVMEAFMYRFHPQWQRVHEIVRAGEIGPIHAIQTVFAYTQRDPANIRNVLASGGGGIYDIGCYAVSCSRFLLGREPQRAVSLVRRDPAFGTDILASAILDFGAAHATFTVSTQMQPAQRVDVVGATGRITVHLPFNAWTDVPLEVTVTTGVGTRTIESPIADQYVLMFEAFSRAVRSGGPAPAPARDAIENMKVLDALFRSEKSGGWESVA
jgi:predicted dehydrogenase